MRLPLDLAAHLRLMGYLADGPAEDIAAALDELLVAATVAVPTLLAVAVTVYPHELPVTIAAFATVEEPSPPVLSSLRIRLPGRNGATVSLSAAAPHALTQLALDLPELLNVHRASVAVDDDLTLPLESQTAGAFAARLQELSSVDRALGVLLDRGYLLDEGLAELRRLADAAGIPLVAAARQLLADLRAEPPARDA